MLCLFLELGKTAGKICLATYYICYEVSTSKLPSKKRDLLCRRLLLKVILIKKVRRAALAK